MAGASVSIAVGDRSVLVDWTSLAGDAATLDQDPRAGEWWRLNVYTDAGSAVIS